jgi:signal peptidase I
MRNSATLTIAAPRLPALAQLRGAFERTNKVAGISLAILVCLFWTQYLRPQSLGGNAAYVLVSGKSMLPRYHTGDLVLVERHSAYHVGELIAYRVPKGDPMAGAQVIHRIIGGDAKHGFIVKGDNRTAEDVWRPKPGDIVGAKALRIPNAVLILQFLRDPIFLGLLAACFVFVQVLTRGDRKEKSA